MDRPTRPDDDLTLAPEAPSAVDAPIWPGTTRLLGGRYRLEEPLATGGAAIVWRAYDDVLGRSVAVKLLHPHLAGHEDTVERFRREAIAAAKLAHPNVVAIYDTAEEDGVVYLIMEYVDGPSLKDILRDLGPLDPSVVAALGEQLASALGEAHDQGLVHRDVKPANILITNDGVAKVTDFGIAKAIGHEASTITGPGTVVGTAAYLAPEQLEGPDVDARADVYALGMVLYECLTGEQAFKGDTPTAVAAARLAREPLPPRALRADIPRALNDIVARSTRRDPGERYQDGRAMAAALAPLVHARPTEITASLVPSGGAHDDGSPPPLHGIEPPPDAGRRGRSGAIWIALLLVLSGVAAYLASRNDATAPVDGNVVPIAAAHDHDPCAEPPGENSQAVPRSFDGRPSTAWTTERYRNDPVFGGLKPGVGVVYDLGTTTLISSVRLDQGLPGVDLALFAATELPEASCDLAGWGEPALLATDVGGLFGQVLPAPVTGRYFLVWITSLARGDDGRYRAELTEVAFIGAEN